MMSKRKLTVKEATVYESGYNSGCLEVSEYCWHELKKILADGKGNYSVGVESLICTMNSHIQYHHLLYDRNSMWYAIKRYFLGSGFQTVYYNDGQPKYPMYVRDGSKHKCTDDGQCAFLSYKGKQIYGKGDYCCWWSRAVPAHHLRLEECKERFPNGMCLIGMRDKPEPYIGILPDNSLLRDGFSPLTLFVTDEDQIIERGKIDDSVWSEIERENKQMAERNAREISKDDIKRYSVKEGK